MKTPEEIVRDLDRRLARSWAATLTDAPDAPTWPMVLPLGQPTGAELAAGFAGTARLAARWRAWAPARGLTLQFRARRVLATDQELPTHVHVPDLDTAATVCAGQWPARLARGRRRAAVLAARYPHLPAPARTLAAVDSLSDVDFDLLCRAADWFATHDAAGRTPRQVPIAGLHAKWLNTRQGLVRDLAGVTDLRLAPPHPARIHFTYLDPAHRAAGGRVHDSATVDDTVVLPYRPTVVVISENKDTAIHFPPIPGGVSVEGVGKGGATVAAFDWLVTAPLVVYWGDMDADGLEILDGFRAAGVPAAAVLMDPAAYAEWERFGTDLDPRGRPLEARQPRALPHLTDDERVLYLQLTSASWNRSRRIEQERIPLTVALAAVQRLLLAHPAS
ncbi:MAG: Wadjet anti-phage system protein JetD domain-containing protein [Actinomycetes bacterium]